MIREGIYSIIIEAIFQAKYRPGLTEFDFKRADIVHFGTQLGIDLPKNLGDLVYSFRYRAALPHAIQETAGEGRVWIIRPVGRARYRFVQIEDTPIIPNSNMTATKIPDATPGIVAKYAFNDEQALLARIRYNRLLDIFTGVTCYSLQNHLRTTVPDMGQVETDEIYVGIDKQGTHYVFPVQAKGGTDRLNIVQIEQDFAVCARKFPSLVCRAIAAQFLDNTVVALFEFEQTDERTGISSEKHYRLVPPDQITDEDLRNYRSRLPR